MGLARFIVDRWSALNYKSAFADTAYKQPNRNVFPHAMRTWVPKEDRRRLAAYTLFAAYAHNQAWEVASIQDHTDASARREFGDPAMLVASITSHMLGRQQTITVPGAEDAEPSDGTQATPEARHAADVQEKLRAWAKAEHFPLRLQQAERKAVREGDTVYLLGLDAAKGRPRLSVIDPGLYFPDLPDNAGDSADYPDRIHLAWEIDADPLTGAKAKMRRVTYELGPIGTRTVSSTDGPRPGRVPAYDVDGATPLMTGGDVYDPAAGTISRLYPWNTEPSTVTCYLTDAEWDLDDIKADQDVHNLDYRYATFLTRHDGEILDHLDLQIDFIPAVHVPNTIPEDGHWGESSLSPLLQLFDELQGTDTDSSQASATTGAPILGIVAPKDRSSRRGENKRIRVQPGMVIELGEGGKLFTVDTSPQLAELRNKTTELQDRLSLNARMPAVALGALDPTKAPSGFAIDLSYGPMEPLLDSMHLARDGKYSLLFKMVQRLYKAFQHPDWTGPVVDVDLAWGTYKPTDKAAVLEQVRNGVKDGVMSLETGIRLLVEAGYPVDDIGEEIERIQSRQFEAARNLADATGSTEAVGDFLGIDINPDPAAPEPNLPPANPADGTADDQEEPQSGKTGGSK
ncbi:hypothetical protein E6R18_25100 [Streptomyces sp. A1277]|uniref:hypothetical protein n=1 Tax=Streptomyces sp. A1277 TaxID=2563103 RepID=UPI0010A286D8|nr:hypothetical protein [Streptomyces sp. A1277]THA29192.1 hypothetical protein E6R18_25100 [Streptomyces sp. A1277]